METTSLTLEVNADFGRTMNKIIFDRYLQEGSADDEDGFNCKLQMPPPPPPKAVPYYGMMELERTKGVKEKWMYRHDEVHYTDAKDFTDTFKDFCFASLFIKEEVIKAL
jgi:dynein heavy chain